MNKKIAIEVAEIPSKRLRNKIAGYVTHLMRRIESGPVRGISLQLQEAEREKRMNDDAKVSEIDLSNIMVDPSTYAMVDAMGLKRCDNIKMVDKSFSEVYAI